MGWPLVLCEMAFGHDGGGNPIYENIPTAHILEFHIRRGRQNELDRYEAGTMDIILDNRDARYDPAYQGATYNHILNPSYETVTTNVTTVGTATGWSQNAAVAQVGTKNATIQHDGVSLYSGYDFKATGLVGGSVYTASAYVRRTNGAGQFWIWFLDDVGAVLGAAMCYDVGEITDGGGFDRFSVSGTYPSGRNGVAFIRLTGEGTPAGNSRVDAVQINPGALADYMDGSSSFDNTRWEGVADTSWTIKGGPYYPNVRPFNEIRLSATWDSVQYFLFTGFVEEYPEIRESFGMYTVKLRCVDLFKILALAKTSAVWVQEATHTRITKILDDVDQHVFPRSIDTGVSTIKGETLVDYSELQLAQDTEKVERGRFFIEPDGTARFMNRNTPHAAPYDISQGSFTDVPDGVKLPYEQSSGVLYNDTNLWNEIRVTRDGGTTQIALNTTTIAHYWRRTLSVSTKGISDPEAADTATSLLFTYGQMRPTFAGLKINPELDDLLWPQVLGRDLVDRITAEVNRKNVLPNYQIAYDFVIEALDHHATRSKWDTTWGLSLAQNLSYWVLDSATESQLDTTTTLGF